MNTRFIKQALPAAITLAVAACGGGGVAPVITGIGGSGFIATGTVTGFGSVFVNGVEFETSGSVFDIDGSSGTQSDLAVGMVVQVSGSVNNDGVTGTATEIRFDDQLQGPVSNLVRNADGENLSFEVLGITVRVNSVDTVFDNSATYGFDDIINGNNIEISGFFNTTGELVATRVALKNVSFDATSIIELKDTISNLANTTFNLGNIIVDASAAAIDNLPNGLADGALVEVKGTYNSGSSTVTATRVEGRSSGVDDTIDKISIEGIVTDYVDDSNFILNGVNIDASSATLSPTTLVIRDGARIEAEGPVSGGVLQALTVELRGGDARVYATVSSVDPSGDFVVSPVFASTIAVNVTAMTEQEDPVAVGNFVRVRGFEDDSGGITATRVEVRSSADDVIVRGTIESGATTGSVRLIGVEFMIDGGTEFKNEFDQPINSSTFFGNVKLDSSLIKVKDKKGSSNTPPNGIADEIEIETP
jgi:hypothetical protein